MEELDLSYEQYADGIIIADYSDENNPRFCGESFFWRRQPVVHDPFETKEQAKDAASAYFTGK